MWSVILLSLLFSITNVFFFVLSDINKFLWMVRIGGSTDRGAHIKEHDYYTPQGEFRVDKEGSPTLLNCLMYKMCYYRFGSVYTESGKCNRDALGMCISGIWECFAFCMIYNAIEVVHHMLSKMYQIGANLYLLCVVILIRMSKLSAFSWLFCCSAIIICTVGQNLNRAGPPLHVQWLMV